MTGHAPAWRKQQIVGSVGDRLMAENTTILTFTYSLILPVVHINGTRAGTKATGNFSSKQDKNDEVVKHDCPSQNPP